MSIGNELLSKLRKMRTLADDDEDATQSSGPSKGQALQQPAWMRNLLERCTEWLGQLPTVCFNDKLDFLQVVFLTTVFLDFHAAGKAKRRQSRPALPIVLP